MESTRNAATVETSDVRGQHTMSVALAELEWHWGRGSGRESVVTGAPANSVMATVLAKYPGATVDVVESDTRGGYEAHITTSAGRELHVGVSAAFAVTGPRIEGRRYDRA